jgi:hypothetical protein
LLNYGAEQESRLVKVKVIVNDALDCNVSRAGVSE